jgi:hypothetical protein
MGLLELKELTKEYKRGPKVRRGMGPVFQSKIHGNVQNLQPSLDKETDCIHILLVKLSNI